MDPDRRMQLPAELAHVAHPQRAHRRARRSGSRGRAARETPRCPRSAYRSTQRAARASAARRARARRALRSRCRSRPSRRAARSASINPDRAAPRRRQTARRNASSASRVTVISPRIRPCGESMCTSAMPPALRGIRFAQTRFKKASASRPLMSYLAKPVRSRSPDALVHGRHLRAHHLEYIVAAIARLLVAAVGREPFGTLPAEGLGVHAALRLQPIVQRTHLARTRRRVPLRRAGAW